MTDQEWSIFLNQSEKDAFAAMDLSQSNSMKKFWKKRKFRRGARLEYRLREKNENTNPPRP